MSKISRLFDFTAGQVIASDQVDQEFDQLVSTVNDLDAANMSPSFAKDVVEPAFSNWRPYAERNAQVFNGTAAGAVVLENMVIPIALADFAAGLRSLQWRVRLMALINSTAPGVTATLGLSLLNTSSGSGDVVSALTVADVASSTTPSLALTSTAARGYEADGGAFTVPGDGLYCLTLRQTPANVSGYLAAGRLEYRYA